MLKVSTGQQKRIEEKMRASLPDEILDMVQGPLAAYRGNTFQEPSREDVDAWIVTASGYGIVTLKGIKMFAALCVTMGPEFHRLPLMSRYLVMPELTGDQKLRLLSNMIEIQAAEGPR